MKKILFVFVLIISKLSFSQELNPIVAINTQQVNLTQKSVFKTLEKSLQEFIGQTRWTNLKVRDNERINCHFTLVVSKYENNRIDATLLVQSSRPVFNSSYQTPIFNLQDKELSFSYQEHETLSFAENIFQSNLTSVVTYYVYLILGFDANTFVENGGNSYFTKAQNIVINAQSSGFVGWTDNGTNNRWMLITDLLSDNYKEYHKAWYQYHRLGLDTMTSDDKKAKQEIINAIASLAKVPNQRLNSYPNVLFFNAKADEITSIFSVPSSINTAGLKQNLQKIAPSQSAKWNAIK